ncbi:MAG: hypothetical protein ACQGVC_12765 [Myxococcota bacterium]
MPNLMALMIATMIAWLVKDALPNTGDVPFPTLIAMCVWIAVFPVAKRVLVDIRPGE